MPSGSTLLRVDVDARRRLVSPGGSWHGLLRSLATDLEPLLSHEAPVPKTKARLTRIGGRCPVDGLPLAFDPWSPQQHRCSRCGTTCDRPEDHEWWALGAHLWTAERAVHASALHLLDGSESYRAIATRILERVSTQYLRWPNRDNVLGPSRPFFSTYLESIWLLNLCHAVALLESVDTDARTAKLLSAVRDKVIEPSLSLISLFNEGLSNRQVWNEVAILSALRVLGRDAEFATRAESANGFTRFLRDGLLEDGTWYEGENYHQFAQRGLWYGVQLFDALDIRLDAALRARFAEAFVAPFAGVLPDETFPSRRDSQYRVSIRQWRFAEWCELGLTERWDDRLAAIRGRLYDGNAPRGDTGRSRSTADAERNEPPTTLTRSDCSWRALLVADGDSLTAAPARATSSVLLESQGLAVIRRDAASVYIALEGGHSGGGHGHPDRLALTLQCGTTRYLEDPGTGSYVDPSLHWYRSTLAHHAPLIDRASQGRGPTTLLAYEDRGGAGWIAKQAQIAQDVTATRTVVVCDGYLVDVLEWQSLTEHELMLPLCSAADLLSDVSWRDEVVTGGGGLEDGFDFVADMQVATVNTALLDFEPAAANGAARHDARLWIWSSTPAELVRATVPAPPGLGDAQRHWLRTRAAGGRMVSCWNWNRAGATRVVRVDVQDQSGQVAVAVTTADGTTANHSRVGESWHIDLLAAGARSSIDLEGWRRDVDDEVVHVMPAAPSTPSASASRQAPTLRPEASQAIVLATDTPIRWELARPHYLRTDESWEEAGEPRALVSLRAGTTSLEISVDAHTGPVVAPPPGTENPLDNERADVNADGVQLYFGESANSPWSIGWLAVPADPPRVTSLVAGQTAMPEVSVTTTPVGWAMTIAVPRSALPVRDGRLVFDLVVNERPAGRERRRGQLVLSGGGGFAYLRGDRHDNAGAITLQLP